MAAKSSTPDPIILLVIGTSLLMASGSVVFTLLPSMQDEVGFPTWGFGLIAGVFFATSLLAQLLLAGHADRGRARILLVAAIVIGAAGLLWMATADSLPELIMARGLGGLAGGCWAPAARATAIAARPDRTATRLGYLAMGDTSGLVIGPLLGSVVATAFSPQTAFLVFALSILALTPVLFLSPTIETRPRTATPRATDLLRLRPVRQAMLLAVALFLPVGFYETVWAKHISNLGGSSHIIALSIAAYGLPYMVMAPLGGRLGDRVGAGRVAALGAVGLVGITAITGLPRSYWILLPIGVVEAAISAVAYTNALAAMAAACPADRQAAGQGLAGSASIAGAGAMALLGGPLFAATGASVSFAVTALLVALGALLAYRIDPDALLARSTSAVAAPDQPVSRRG